MEHDSGVHVRRVSHKGDRSWNNERYFIREIFGGQALGLRPSHDRYYEVLYGPLCIGWFAIFRLQFHRREPQALRRERAAGPWQ